jgi:hypothetical protein
MEPRQWSWRRYAGGDVMGAVCIEAQYALLEPLPRGNMDAGWHQTAGQDGGRHDGRTFIEYRYNKAGSYYG